MRKNASVGIGKMTTRKGTYHVPSYVYHTYMRANRPKLYNPISNGLHSTLIGSKKKVETNECTLAKYIFSTLHHTYMAVTNMHSPHYDT